MRPELNYSIYLSIYDLYMLFSFPGEQSDAFKGHIIVY